MFWEVSCWTETRNIISIETHQVFGHSPTLFLQAEEVGSIADLLLSPHRNKSGFCSERPGLKKQHLIEWHMEAWRRSVKSFWQEVKQTWPPGCLTCWQMLTEVKTKQPFSPELQDTSEQQDLRASCGPQQAVTPDLCVVLPNSQVWTPTSSVSLSSTSQWRHPWHSQTENHDFGTFLEPFLFT